MLICLPYTIPALAFHANSIISLIAGQMRCEMHTICIYSIVLIVKPDITSGVVAQLASA